MSALCNALHGPWRLVGVDTLKQSIASMLGGVGAQEALVSARALQLGAPYLFVQIATLRFAEGLVRHLEAACGEQITDHPVSRGIIIIALEGRLPVKVVLLLPHASRHRLRKASGRNGRPSPDDGISRARGGPSRRGRGAGPARVQPLTGGGALRIDPDQVKREPAACFCQAFNVQALAKFADANQPGRSEGLRNLDANVLRAAAQLKPGILLRHRFDAPGVPVRCTKFVQKPLSLEGFKLRQRLSVRVVEPGGIEPPTS